MKRASISGIGSLLRPMRRIFPWVLGFALGSAAYPGVAGSVVLDQSQTETPTAGWLIGGGYRPEMAQVVTAGRYGILDSVELYLDNISASRPVQVSIQTVVDGEPSGTELGHGEVQAVELPLYDQPGWVEATIRANVPVQPGDQFAVVVASPSGAIRWFASRNSPAGYYSGGHMLVNEGYGWIISWYGYDDAMFRTYVRPDVLDQSQTVYGVLESTRSQTRGQVFTAGRTGFLDRVSLLMENGDLGCEPASGVDVTIETVTQDGYPSGTVIGQGSLTNLPDTGSWVSTGIHGAYVIAGQKYAILVKGWDGCWYWAYVAPWYDYDYAGGHRLYESSGNVWEVYPSQDHAFQTYVATPIMFSPAPPPPLVSTPCAAGVCPSVKATLTPADSAARITSNVEFRARQDGSVHGVLTFNNSRTGDLLLQGCTTRSAACGLAVKTFTCTAPDQITIEGTYTQKGAPEEPFTLVLDGTRDQVGTFSLRAKERTHTFTRYGLVEVTCPPVASL